MVSIKINRSTVAAGKRVEKGQVVQVEENEARTLISLGKAVPAGEPGQTAQNRDEEVAEQTNKRTTGGGRSKKKKDD